MALIYIVEDDINIRHFAGGYGIRPYESHPQGRIL